MKLHHNCTLHIAHCTNIRLYKVLNITIFSLTILLVRKALSAGNMRCFCLLQAEMSSINQPLQYNSYTYSKINIKIKSVKLCSTENDFFNVKEIHNKNGNASNDRIHCFLLCEKWVLAVDLQATYMYFKNQTNFNLQGDNVESCRLTTVHYLYIFSISELSFPVSLKIKFCEPLQYASN